MDAVQSRGSLFVRQVLPFLTDVDVESLHKLLKRDWPNRQLCALLDTEGSAVRKVVLVCLTLTGTMDEVPAVSEQLRNDDPDVAGFAEHALWSIWFRAAGDPAETALNQAVRLLGENRLDEAQTRLVALTRQYPFFAEAYNQLAIANFLKGDYAATIDHCEKALALNEWHFGAMAGLGHSYAALGQLHQALSAYTKAMQCHPRLEGIRHTSLIIRRNLKRVDSNVPKATT